MPMIETVVDPITGETHQIITSSTLDPITGQAVVNNGTFKHTQGQIVDNCYNPFFVLRWPSSCNSYRPKHRSTHSTSYSEWTTNDISTTGYNTLFFVTDSQIKSHKINRLQVLR